MDTRRGWHYCLKIAVGLVLLLFIYRIHSVVQTRMAGLLFFQMVAPTVYFIYSVASYISFSNLVVKDRESGELDLLLISGIGKLTYLFNVFFASWISFLNLLIVQIPLAMYVITFGGVHPAQVASFYIYLVVWLFFVAQLSFCCGVIFSKVRESYLISAVLLVGIYRLLGVSNLGGLQQIESFWALGVTEVIYNDDLYYFLALAILLFGFSWLWIERKDTVKLSFLEPIVKRFRTKALLISSGHLNAKGVERVTVRFYSYPFMVKDMFLHPPLNVIIANTFVADYRKVCFVILFIALLVGNVLLPGLLILFVLTTFLHLNRFICCLLSEVREGTLPSLMTLPMETSEIIDEKMQASQSYTALLKGIYVVFIIGLGVIAFWNLFGFIYFQLFLAAIYLPVLLKVSHYVCFLMIISLPQVNRGLCFGAIAVIAAFYLLMPLVTGPLFILLYFYLRAQAPTILESRVATMI